MKGTLTGLLGLLLLAGWTPEAAAQTPPPPTVTLTPNIPGVGRSVTLPEGAGLTFNINLSRSLAADEMVTLPLTVGGTATRGTDYRLVCIEAQPAAMAATCNGIGGANPSITFHGGYSRRMNGPLRIEAIKDNTAEPNETVTLSLGGGTVRTITLKEAPSSVALSFSLATYSRPESNDIVEPVLRASAAPGGDIVVPLVFTDITATGGRITRPGTR